MNMIENELKAQHRNVNGLLTKLYNIRFYIQMAGRGIKHTTSNKYVGSNRDIYDM